MNEHFLTYEQCLTVKELGFDEPCIAWHVSKTHGLELGTVIKSDLLRDGVLAPLKQQFFKWVREKYGLIGWVEGKLMYKYCIESNVPTDGQLNQYPFKTYEQAEDSCINKIIELLKLK